MRYALEVGTRYLRSKKRDTVSVISVIAVTGVALGVGALLAVVSITSGFQDEFRNKVLGVNGHVLVLKYGLSFEEYRDVMARAEEMPEVVGAAPFIINEMMMAKGDRLSGVLIKGVDPERMPKVLDLPSQLIAGTLEGMRLSDARPATRPEELQAEVRPDERDDLDAFLAGLTAGGRDAGTQLAGSTNDGVQSAPDAAVAHEPPPTPEPAAPIKVPTPEEAEAALAALEASEEGALPSDESEGRLVDGSEPDANEPKLDRVLPGVVVGATLAEKLGLKLDDEVRVISPLTGLDTSLWRPDGGMPSSRDYRVTGIFQAGFQEYDSRLVYMDLYEAQIFQDQGDTVIGVEIRLRDMDDAGEVALRLERQLGGGPFRTMDWKELNYALFTTLEVQKLMLSFVIATIILVAAFNVIATLIMAVLEKRREIAILKAMGAKDLAILVVFMVQGTAIGIVGTVIGLLLGGGVCAYLAIFEFPLDPKIYLIDHLPIRTTPTEVIVTTLVALGICVIATVIPSYWAARTLPAEGIRPQ
jgi:lipoprotein-releasing system permease protein